MSQKTLSEQLTEDFFDRHRIGWQRIRPAKVDGFKRPDYAITVNGNRCIIEVKELVPNDEDKALLENLSKGIVTTYWAEPGKRLRRPIEDKEKQLRKFSAHGLPTIICLLDTTASFHTLDVHIRAAMFGAETLHFAVSEDTGTANFMGTAPGKGATLRWDKRTTVSAVAVLRQPSGSDMVADLYHNPYAAVPIDRAAAKSFVREQIEFGETAAPQGPSWFDVRDNPEYADFFKDPQAAAERVIREILEGNK